MSVEVSIVVPVYNEVENVGILYDELTQAMRRQSRPYEIVMVDDGSMDGTTAKLERQAAEDPRVKLVIFRRNYGQTAAMQAGIQHATGESIVMLDGDLQNDPADIPMMLDKLDEGFDLVHGWRKHRQDAWINRKLPSKIANWLISKVTGFPVHDLGCTLKAVRSDIAKRLELYGEMHRFIPILAHREGAKCVEVVTNHRARQFGQTKYGIGRTSRVVLDLLTVKYMLKYFASPMKLFGTIGLWIGFVAFACGVATLLMKWPGGMDMTGNPLLLMSFMSAMISIQFFSLGLLGEVNARIYFRNDRRETYSVRHLVNFEEADVVPLSERQRAA